MYVQQYSDTLTLVNLSNSDLFLFRELKEEHLFVGTAFESDSLYISKREIIIHPGFASASESGSIIKKYQPVGYVLRYDLNLSLDSVYFCKPDTSLFQVNAEQTKFLDSIVNVSK